MQYHFAVKNRPDILQLVQKIDPIFCSQKSTRYFATCTKNKSDILLSKINSIFLKLYKNRPDILLSKNQLDIFNVVQKSTRYFAAKKSSWFFS